MQTKALLYASILMLTATVATVPAGAGGLTDYDVKNAQTWADALAICDTTRFLLSDPKLDASVIISAMPDKSHVALYPPYFIPTSSFYSDVVRNTYERVRKAGQVTADAYGKARMRYARLMLRAYPYASASDQAFLSDQMKTCYALAVDTTGQARGAAK